MADDEKNKKDETNFVDALDKLAMLTGTKISDLTKDFFEFNNAFINLERYASGVNRELLLTRSRISEFKVTIADTIPLIAKLGGGFEQTEKLISDTTAELGRNVIFNPEIYEKLYAASQLLGKDASTLIRNFSEAGIMASKIGKNLETSLDYIRTVGVNAKNVMGNIVDEAKLLNRFSFQEGVLGFTKMAAQASILKVTMYDIEKFADKVFEPEGAIDTAAAFQRLGVFVGDLADPFMLMNKSLNDPQGLIMGLARAGEKFTQFNEEAGRFEINPSAMNQMAKMAEAAGMSTSEFKKMSLNLAEFNARASEIDIKFNLTDEQKMFVANLAYLDTDNEYKIKVTDEKTGESVTTAVKDLTENQIAKLNELSKQEPKTLEDLTKDSMNITETIRNDVAAIKAKFLFGAVSEQSFLGKVQENIRTGALDLGDIVYKGIPEASKTRETIRGVVNPAFNMYKEGDFGENMIKILQSVGSYISEIPKNISQGIKDSKLLGPGLAPGYGLNDFLKYQNGLFDISSSIEKFFNIQSDQNIKNTEIISEVKNIVKDTVNNPKPISNTLTLNVDIKNKNENGLVIKSNKVEETIKWNELSKNSKSLSIPTWS